MKEFSPYYAKLNLVEMFNEADKAEENGVKKNNYDNYENMNENIIINNYNWKQNDGIKRLCKKIDFNNEDKNENKIFISESGALLSDILNIHKNSRKYNYNIQMINTDFNDFINLCSINNDENQNIENISNFNNSYSGFNQIERSNSNYKKSFQKLYSNNANKNKYIILSNGQRQLDKNSLTCTCKNSSCLKFYCECFSNGKYCQNCSCINCKNISQYETLRQEKYKNIIDRNPKAVYQINSVKKSFICNCKNSNCSKKYCDCFQVGKRCTSKCKCINCLNRVPNSNDNNKNNRRRRKMRRIRGIKNNKNNNDLYLTPQKRKKRRNINYDLYGDKNQSTAAVTEGNSNILTDNKNKNIMFNIDSNKNKFKEVSQRLKMEMNN